LSVGLVISEVNSELEQTKRAYSVNVEEGKYYELSNHSCNPYVEEGPKNTINKEIAGSASGHLRKRRSNEFLSICKG
jgi:hypothetical protein